MTFQIKEIDHALEWIIRDEVIRRGYWPKQRDFLANNDEAGYQSALNEFENSSFDEDFSEDFAGLKPKIEVFGSANYKDRKQLKRNNCIIERIGPIQGDVGFSFPFHFVRQEDFSFKKMQTGEGLYDIPYEIRFVCNDIDLDRALTQIMLDAFGQHKTIPGLNDDMTPTADKFMISRNGEPIDVSNGNYIERVYRYTVKDLELQEEKEVETAAMLQEFSTVLNVPKDENELLAPEDSNDAATIGAYRSGDYFKSLVENLDSFRSMDRINIYAQVETQAALTPIKGNGVSIESTDIVFTRWKGLSKAVAEAYINTLFDRSTARQFKFTHCSYTFILMTAPGANAVDLAGMVDGVSDFRVRGDADGIYVKMNSLMETKLVSYNFKALKVYVLNKPQSNILELWEDGERVGRSLVEVVIPASPGVIYELNVNSAGPVSAATAGDLGFSSYGPGLTVSQLRTWSAQVKAYFSKLGYQ